MRYLKLLPLALLAAATMSSCSSNEEPPAPEPPVPGQPVEMTFVAKLFDTSTRAEATDAQSIDKLRYAVYDSKGTYIFGSEEEDSPVAKLGDDGKFYLTLQLVTNEKYKIAFWAQNSGVTAYTFSEDKKSINVDYSNMPFNNQQGDAFYNCINDVTPGTTTRQISLSRPLAQVNVGVTNTLTKDQLAKLKTLTSTVTLTDIPTSINLQTGEVSAPSAVNYSATIGELLTLEYPYPGANAKYIALGYVLATRAFPTVIVVGDGDATGTNLLSTLTIGLNGKTFNMNNVPLCSNKRTNIYGAFLQVDESGNVSINPSMGGSTKIEIK